MIFCLANQNTGIRGITNKWFESYLEDRQQFVSVNDYNSEYASIPTGVPQESVLGHLLFLLDINNLNLAIKHHKLRHFADDTNLLFIDNCIKKLNKLLKRIIGRIKQVL